MSKSKHVVIQLPALGECCGPAQSCCESLKGGGEREFVVKVKVQCGDGDEGCRIEIAHPEGCCDTPGK